MSLAFWGEHERYFHHNHSHGPVSFHRELRTSSGTTRRAYATRLTQVGRFLAHATQIPSTFVALAGGVVAPPLEHISSPRQTMRVIPVHSIAECLSGPWSASQSIPALPTSACPGVCIPSGNLVSLGIGVPAFLFIHRGERLESFRIVPCRPGPRAARATGLGFHCHRSPCG